MRKNGDMWAGFFFAFFGIAVVIGSLGLPLGTPIDPHPGFFPLMTGIFLSGLSIIHLICAFLKKSGPMQAFGAVGRPAFLIATRTPSSSCREAWNC